MSWSSSGDVTSSADIDALEVPEQTDTAAERSAGQIDTARQALRALIDSGHLGAGPWHVQLAGHASPIADDGTVAPGETVGVSIRSLS